MEEEEKLRKKLEALRSEHRDLDSIIDRLHEAQPVDFLQLQRMKKRKLQVKDTITKIEAMLVPDIIA